MRQCTILALALTFVALHSQTVAAEEEKDFSYDHEVVTRLSLNELKSITSDAGIDEFEVQDIPSGGYVLMGRHDGYRIFVFLQRPSTVVAEYVAPEHQGTTEKLNQFHKSGLTHGVTGQIDDEGRAKLTLYIDCQYGLTKKTIRKQLSYFSAVQVKLFHGLVCK
jgi:hypothetical protein